MFIKNFSIRHFRNIQSLDLHLCKGLNVFIGENNSGKTAAIDALRIRLGWGDQDKNIFVKTEDLYIDRTNHAAEIKPIEFDLTFEIEDPSENAIFYDPLSKNGSGLELQVHYRFWFEKRNERNLFRCSIWGGIS